MFCGIHLEAIFQEVHLKLNRRMCPENTFETITTYLKDQFSAANLALMWFSLTNAVGENMPFAIKTCLTYAFVTQQPFGIPYWNLDTCIFVASTTGIFTTLL